MLFNTRIYGQFFEEESYIILRVTSDKMKNVYYIHYWCGKQSPMDSQAAAGFFSVELKKLLREETVYYCREQQGEESDLFLSYWSLYELVFHVKIHGKAQPSLKHVDKSYRSRLIHVQGNKTFKVKQVAVEADSLNSQDCFILDHGLEIFLFISKGATRHLKTKAMEIATKLKVEVGCSRAVQVIDEGEDNPDFWQHFGFSHQGISIQEDHEEDTFTSDWLYEVTEESGKTICTPLDHTEFTRAMLHHNCSCILLAYSASSLNSDVLDCETELFLWHSKESSLEQKVAALQLAEEIKDMFERPLWTSITRVNEGNEPILFKEKFVDWIDYNTSVASHQSSLSSMMTSAAASLPLFIESRKETNPLLESVEETVIEIWGSSVGDHWVHIDKQDHGFFCDSRSYVCQFMFKAKGSEKLKCKVFFW